MPKLSQETIATLGVGIGLAALILITTADLRAEIREWRFELRTEIRDVRIEAYADRETLRAEVRDEAAPRKGGKGTARLSGAGGRSRRDPDRYGDRVSTAFYWGAGMILTNSR